MPTELTRLHDDDMCNYTDDNTLNAFDGNFHQVLEINDRRFRGFRSRSTIILWSLIFVNKN